MPLLRVLTAYRKAGQDRCKKNCGQSSVEYAVVLAAFLALMVGLGVMGRFMSDGMIIDHALQSASHHLQEVAAGAWSDVFLY